MSAVSFIDFVVALVDVARKPVELCGSGNLVIAVDGSHIAILQLVAECAHSVSKFVGKDNRAVAVGVAAVFALGRAVAIESAHGVNHSVIAERHRIFVGCGFGVDVLVP